MDQQTNPTESLSDNTIFTKLSDNELVEKVFSIQLIFEKVLKLLIFNGSKLDIKMVQTLRRVQKHWLTTTSTLLTTSDQHMILIKTDNLNESINRFTFPQRLFNSLLPFKLILTPESFLEKNHQNMVKCLTSLGNELIELQVKFPADGGAMPMTFPKFTLPLLRKLSFKFCSKNDKGVLLLQQILNASENLQNFVTSKLFPSNQETIENFKLPNSIIYIAIEDTLKPGYMEILLKNHLPNLKHLKLYMPCTILEMEMMFKILEHYESTLLSLQLNSAHLQGQKIILKFPKLENLQEMNLHGNEYTFELQGASDLQKLFPSVKTLTLKSKRSLSFETLAQVIVAFPNVSSLTIGVEFDDMSGLLYLFSNMPQLKSLRLDIWEDVEVDGVLTYSSTLMGLPAWLISAHEAEGDFFQSFIRKRGRKTSLLDLSELTSFTLCVRTCRDFDRDFFTKFYRRNITDLLFTQTFFEMPKLRKITLSENLEPPTQQIEETWKAQGRFIEYIGVKD